MIVPKLINIGFTQYEAQIYHALLTNGQVSASTLVGLSGVPHGKIYQVLNTLEMKGFCNVVHGKVKKYKAVDPSVSFRELHSQKRKEEEQILELQEELEKEFIQNADLDVTLDYLQVITSKQSQVQKFVELTKNATESIFTFNKQPYATGYKRNREQLEADSEPLRQIIASGVLVRGIFEKQEEDKENLLEMLRYFESIGEEIRLIDKLPFKMLLADSRVSMVSLRSKEERQFNITSMIINQKDISLAMAELFELYWSKSQTMDDYIS
ncbi:MAG: TrmB family transcriptional regulator [Bacteroidales bacterium]